MRKILTMLFVSFVILSCDKNDDGETTAITVPNQTELEQTVYADNTTGKSGITFTTTGAWTSSINESSLSRSDKTSSPEWISIDPASGDKAGSYTISISLNKNLTGANRSAIITIICGGERITISITQEATTEEGKEPVPEAPDGKVKKINGQIIKYHDGGGLFSKIGDAIYGNKFYSETEWAYLSGESPRFDGWYCYFNYGTNGLVKETTFQYGNLAINQKMSYQWDGNKLIAVYDNYYNEIQNEGMRLNIKYGEVEYSKGNIDINWLITNTIDGNRTFLTPPESSIGIKSIPYNNLISQIEHTDLNIDKYSAVYTYRYDLNSEGYITKIYEKYTMKLDGYEQDERFIYSFDY